MKVRDKVKELLGRLVNVNNPDWNDELILGNDLDIEFLDMLEVNMSLENEYEVEITDDIEALLKLTVAEFISLVDIKVKGR